MIVSEWIDEALIHLVEWMETLVPVVVFGSEM